MDRKGHLPPATSPLGFTLVELMVTLAILAIIATIGVPSFQRLIADYRVSAQANSVQGLLQFARSEAVKRRENVAVCLKAGVFEVRIGSCDDGSAPLRVLPLNHRVTLDGFNNAPGITYAPSGFLTDSPPTLTFGAEMASDRSICIMRSGFSDVSFDCSS